MSYLISESADYYIDKGSPIHSMFHEWRIYIFGIENNYIYEEYKYISYFSIYSFFVILK